MPQFPPNHRQLGLFFPFLSCQMFFRTSLRRTRSLSVNYLLKKRDKFVAEISLSLYSSGVHQSLPPGERSLCGQEEDQSSEEVSGSSLQSGPGLFWKPTGESGAGKNQQRGTKTENSKYLKWKHGNSDNDQILFTIELEFNVILFIFSKNPKCMIHTFVSIFLSALFLFSDFGITF